MDGRALDKAFLKKLIPIVSYEDVERYIKNIANGNKASILSMGFLVNYLEVIMHNGVLWLMWN